MRATLKGIDMKYRIVQLAEHDFRLERRGRLWGWNRVYWMVHGDYRQTAFASLEKAQAALSAEAELDRIIEENKKFKAKQVWP